MIEKVGAIISSPTIIWGVVILIFVLSHYGIGIRYVSTLGIVKNYINCFKKSNGKILSVPFINYFVLPFVMGYGTVIIKIIDSSTINIITIIISILTAMLFTLLTMVVEMKSKVNQNPQYYSSEAEISKKALIETYYAVMFEILVSIIILLLCFVNCFINSFGKIQSFLIYSLTYLLVINLLIILKRIFKVIDVDISK